MKKLVIGSIALAAVLSGCGVSDMKCCMSDVNSTPVNSAPNIRKDSPVISIPKDENITSTEIIKTFIMDVNCSERDGDVYIYNNTATITTFMYEDEVQFQIDENSSSHLYNHVWDWNWLFDVKDLRHNKECYTVRFHDNDVNSTNWVELSEAKIVLTELAK